MNLPDDCELTYVVPHEAWYRDVVAKNYPSVSVVAEARGGGCAWEFSVDERDLGGPTLHLKMFHDSWDAFAQVPEFFAALQEESPRTLADLRVLLDRIGARDATERVSPYGKTPVDPETVDVALGRGRWRNDPTRTNRLTLIGTLQAVEDDR